MLAIKQKPEPPFALVRPVYATQLGWCVNPRKYKGQSRAMSGNEMNGWRWCPCQSVPSSVLVVSILSPSSWVFGIFLLVVDFLSQPSTRSKNPSTSSVLVLRIHPSCASTPFASHTLPCRCRHVKHRVSFPSSPPLKPG